MGVVVQMGLVVRMDLVVQMGVVVLMVVFQMEMVLVVMKAVGYQINLALNSYVVSCIT
jgi:hypothetical protein